MAKRKDEARLGQTHNRLDGENLWKIEVREPPRKEYEKRGTRDESKP